MLNNQVNTVDTQNKTGLVQEFNLNFNQSTISQKNTKNFHMHTQSQRTLSKSKYQNIILNMKNKKVN